MISLTLIFSNVFVERFVNDEYSSQTAFSSIREKKTDEIVFNRFSLTNCSSWPREPDLGRVDPLPALDNLDTILVGVANVDRSI